MEVFADDFATKTGQKIDYPDGVFKPLIHNLNRDAFKVGFLEALAQIESGNIKLH